MKPETVSLLCTPRTHEPLRLVSEPGPDGGTREVLIGVHSGKRFPVRDGIPLLLDESTISGPNQRFQRTYNRVARLYDGAIAGDPGGGRMSSAGDGALGMGGRAHHGCKSTERDQHHRGVPLAPVLPPVFWRKK